MTKITSYRQEANINKTHAWLLEAKFLWFDFSPWLISHHLHLLSSTYPPLLLSLYSILQSPNVVRINYRRAGCFLHFMTPVHICSPGIEKKRKLSSIMCALKKTAGRYWENHSKSRSSTTLDPFQPVRRRTGPSIKHTGLHTKALQRQKYRHQTRLKHTHKAHVGHALTNTMAVHSHLCVHVHTLLLTRAQFLFLRSSLPAKK